MSKFFVDSKEIKKIKKEINVKEIQFIIAINKLKNLIQQEFDNKYKLVIGKTILLYRNVKYIYAGLDDPLSSLFWIKGFKIKKDGTASIYNHCMYDEWEKA